MEMINSVLRVSFKCEVEADIFFLKRQSDFFLSPPPAMKKGRGKQVALKHIDS